MDVFWHFVSLVLRVLQFMAIVVHYRKDILDTIQENSKQLSGLNARYLYSRAHSAKRACNDKVSFIQIYGKPLYAMYLFMQDTFAHARTRPKGSR